MTPDYQSVASMLLGDLGAPDIAQLRLAVEAWTLAESGGTILGNNPWNLHVGPDCPPTSMAGVLGLNPSQRLTGNYGLVGNRYAGPGDRNVAIFSSLGGGVQACVANLVNWGAAEPIGYDHVIAAARAGDVMGFLAALARSSWSAGHYGSPSGDPATNSLVTIYRRLGGTEGGVPVRTFVSTGASGKATVLSDAPHAAPALDGVSPWPRLSGGQTFENALPIRLASPIPGGLPGEDRVNGYLVVIGGLACIVLAKDSTFVPATHHVQLLVDGGAQYDATL